MSAWPSSCSLTAYCTVDSVEAREDFHFRCTGFVRSFNASIRNHEPRCAQAIRDRSERTEWLCWRSRGGRATSTEVWGLAVVQATELHREGASVRVQWDPGTRPARTEIRARSLSGRDVAGDISTGGGFRGKLQYASRATCLFLFLFGTDNGQLLRVYEVA